MDKACWSKFVIGVLVIVFAWIGIGWSVLGLTVLGILLIAMACKGECFSCKTSAVKRISVVRKRKR